MNTKTLLSAVICLAGCTMLALAVDPAPKRPLINGDFKDSPVGKPPAGWTPAYPNAGGTIFSDGKDTFLRLASAQPTNAGMAQEIEVPPKATSVAVLGRMRGKP